MDGSSEALRCEFHPGAVVLLIFDDETARGERTDRPFVHSSPERRGYTNPKRQRG
jgi:hypothetical protein